MGKSMDMLHGSIWDKALRFAIPLALTGMLQQIFSATDVAVLGRFVGPNAMAAVGSNSPIVSLVINSFVGIAIGANVVIANYIGSGDEDKVSRATHTALTLALISGIVVAGFEPAHDGIRIRCLTAWLYPIIGAVSDMNI